MKEILHAVWVLVVFAACILTMLGPFVLSDYVNYECRRLGYFSGGIVWPGFVRYCDPWDIKNGRQPPVPLSEARERPKWK